MNATLLYIVIVGSVLIAFGLFSLYFSSESAQKKFNPQNETSLTPKVTSIVIAHGYRVRAK